MQFEKKFGFPLVTAATAWEVAQAHGIVPWERDSDPILLEDYVASDLSDEARAELRFAPKTEAVRFKPPMGGLFTGFRVVGKPCSTVFTLIRDGSDLYTVMAVEWRHGCEQVSFTPPTGVPSGKDRQTPDPMAACAIREVQEETGIVVPGVTLLNKEPLPASGRQFTGTVYEYLAEVNASFEAGPTNLDRTEKLLVVVFPLGEWLKFADKGQHLEDLSLSATYLALRYLGFLSFP